MGSQPYNPPRVSLTRIYTRGGDDGRTSLAGGQRLAKDAPRIESYGAVDELNAFLGLARLSAEAAAELAPLARALKRIQHELFNLGSCLATLPEDLQPRQPRLSQADVDRLEAEIDDCNQSLPPAASFVLPGGSRLSVELHLCRTVCRRAERLTVKLARSEPVPPEVIRYLNRLSDAFFVWSRWANARLGQPETLWDPNYPACGSKTPE